MLSILFASLSSARREVEPAAIPVRVMAAGDVYAGSYQCGTAAWLLMHIERATSEGVDAIFHFLYPTSTQHGAYAMRGEWDKTSRQILSFEPAEWLWAKATKVQKVGIMGIVSEDGESFAGEIMHESCGKFAVNRTVSHSEASNPRSTLSPSARVRVPTCDRKWTSLCPSRKSTLPTPTARPSSLR